MFRIEDKITKRERADAMRPLSYLSLISLFISLTSKNYTNFFQIFLKIGKPTGSKISEQPYFSIQKQ